MAYIIVYFFNLNLTYILILINSMITDVLLTGKHILKFKSHPMIPDNKLLRFRGYSLMLQYTVGIPTYYIIYSCSFKTMCKQNAAFKHISLHKYGYIHTFIYVGYFLHFQTDNLIKQSSFQTFCTFCACSTYTFFPCA